MGDAEIKAGRCGPARCTSPSSHLRLTCTLDGMRSGQHTTSSVKMMGAKSSARLGGNTRVRAWVAISRRQNDGNQRENVGGWNWLVSVLG
jgi:hypothetical protein